MRSHAASWTKPRPTSGPATACAATKSRKASRPSPRSGRRNSDRHTGYPVIAPVGQPPCPIEEASPKRLTYVKPKPAHAPRHGRWGNRVRRTAMKHSGKISIATATFACAMLISFDWSAQQGVSLLVESAQARVGRPLTPVSVAGVARRQNRRAVYGAGVGAAAVGTAAAIGTAGYYAGGPYYGGSVRGARAAYYGGDPSAAPAASTGPQPHQGVRAYYAGGPWYGYSGWDDYQARNGIKCTPGTMTKL